MRTTEEKTDIKIPVVGMAARSGTGKTSLLTRLIGVLRNKNLRVGVVKHAHHGFEIDYPGKDSYELRMAGASQVFIGARNRWALIAEHDEENTLSFHEQLLQFNQKELDIILVEGFRPVPIPKIELIRHELKHPFLFPDDSSIIAVAADNNRGLNTSLPILDLNNPEEIADFIIDRFIPNHKINTEQLNNN